MKAFDFDDFEYFLSTREEHRAPTPTRSPKPRFATRSNRYESALRNRRRRRRVLRPQTRHQPARRDRPQMAARHRASRLRLARTLRTEISRQRRQRPSPGDDPSRAGRLDGALLRHPDRALRRRLPAWLAPVQAVLAPISEHQTRLRARSRGAARAAGFRVDVDESNEKLGYKIRHWKTQKVPYILVVGKQEAADGTVNVNERGIEEKRTISVSRICRRTRSKGRNARMNRSRVTLSLSKCRTRRART